MQNYDCVSCKGTRMLCGKPVCPRIQKTFAARQIEVSTEMSGAAPNVFVGRHGYPTVSTGPLITSADTSQPEDWYGKPLEEVVSTLYSLVRSKEPIRVGSAVDPSRDLYEMQDLAMSMRATDTEVFFTRKPQFSKTDFASPYGPSGEMHKFRVTENTKIPRKVDSIVSDELKAAEQMVSLYDSAPVSQISRILSVGLLGFDKRLVPTRWGITATDDTLSKDMLKEIRQYDELDDYLLFSSSYAGNHYHVLLVPGKWCFEVIEMWAGGNIWVDEGGETHVMKDWEAFGGRTKYADSVTGGYYAARLAVNEWMRAKKRQAGCIVVREITPEYWAPTGVWQCRENCRNAMKSKPLKLKSFKEVREELETRLITNRAWEKESELLKRLYSRAIMLKYVSGQ